MGNPKRIQATFQTKNENTSTVFLIMETTKQYRSLIQELEEQQNEYMRRQVFKFSLKYHIHIVFPTPCSFDFMAS